MTQLENVATLDETRTDNLEKYYDYKVEDASEIRKELMSERNQKISTVFSVVTAVSLISGLGMAIVMCILENTSMGIVGIILLIIMLISGGISCAFNDDEYY